jgi:hypothetical protein
MDEVIQHLAMNLQRGRTSACVFAAAARKAPRARRGVAALDYVLVLGVMLPLITFIMWAGPRMIRLAYEMLCVLVSWPFV